MHLHPQLNLGSQIYQVTQRFRLRPFVLPEAKIGNVLLTYVRRLLWNLLILVSGKGGSPFYFLFLEILDNSILDIIGPS